MESARVHSPFGGFARGEGRQETGGFAPGMVCGAWRRTDMAGAARRALSEEPFRL